MPNEFMTRRADQFEPAGAEFVTESADGSLKLFFKRVDDASHRAPGRTFDLVEARYDGFSMVTHGSCNHYPSINAMIELSDPRVAAAREARERYDAAHKAFSDARVALQKAEAELRR